MESRSNPICILEITQHGKRRYFVPRLIVLPRNPHHPILLPRNHYSFPTLITRGYMHDYQNGYLHSRYLCIFCTCGFDELFVIADTLLTMKVQVPRAQIPLGLPSVTLTSPEAHQIQPHTASISLPGPTDRAQRVVRYLSNHNRASRAFVAFVCDHRFIEQRYIASRSLMNNCSVTQVLAERVRLKCIITRVFQKGVRMASHPDRKNCQTRLCCGLQPNIPLPFCRLGLQLGNQSNHSRCLRYVGHQAKIESITLWRFMT